MHKTFHGLANVCPKYYAAIFRSPLDVVGPRHLPTMHVRP